MRCSSNTYLFFATIFVTLYFTLIHHHRFFVTIVKSFSMHPTLNRGDILLSTLNTDFNVNDIVLVQVCIKISVCICVLIFALFDSSFLTPRSYAIALSRSKKTGNLSPKAMPMNMMTDGFSPPEPLRKI